MDIGNPVRRRIIVPKMPRPRPTEPDPAATPVEPVRAAPAIERRLEPA